MLTKKRVGFLTVGTLAGVAAIAVIALGGIAIGEEYQSQKEGVKALEFEAQALTGNADFYDPDSGFWDPAFLVDGKVDESDAAYLELHSTFPNNKVFATPEWLAYDALTKSNDLFYKESDLEGWKQASEEITFPGLNGRASEAYETIEENIDKSLTFPQKQVISEAGILVDETETKEEALELASEWNFDPRFVDQNESYYLTFWGIEDPSKENLNIAREGIRKAITVAVEEYYDVLKNRSGDYK